MTRARMAKSGEEGNNEKYGLEENQNANKNSAMYKP